MLEELLDQLFERASEYCANPDKGTCASMAPRVLMVTPTEPMPSFWAGFVQAAGRVCADRLNVRAPSHSAGLDLLRALQLAHGGTLWIPPVAIGQAHDAKRRAALLCFRGVRKDTLMKRLEPHLDGAPTDLAEWARGYVAASARVTAAALRVSSTAQPEVIAKLRTALATSLPDVELRGDEHLLAIYAAASRQAVLAWMAIPAPPPMRVDEANRRAQRLTLEDDNRCRAGLGLANRNAPMSRQAAAAVLGHARGVAQQGKRMEPGVVAYMAHRSSGQYVTAAQVRHLLLKHNLLGTQRCRMPKDVRARVLADLRDGHTHRAVHDAMRAHLPEPMVPRLDTLAAQARGARAGAARPHSGEDTDAPGENHAYEVADAFQEKNSTAPLWEALRARYWSPESVI